MINPFAMVRADLKKHVWSSFGILLLLSLAFSATVAVSVFERGLRHAGAQASRDTDLVIGAPGSSLQLVLATVFLQTNDVLTLVPAATLEKLARDPRVERISPLVFADHWQSSPIVGVGPDFPALKPNLKVAHGQWPEASFEIMAGADSGVGIGDELVSAHGVAERSGVEEEHHMEAHYTVVGVLRPTGTPWDRSLLTPYRSLWEIHGLEGDEHANADADRPDVEGQLGISAILVKPKSFSAAYALRAQYGQGPTSAVFPGEVLARVFGVFTDVKTAFTAVSVLFQVIVFAAVLLSLLASLPVRVKWIGLLRALGAGRGYIFLTLWIQSAIVFLLAGVTGTLVGWLGATLLSGFVSARTGLRLPLSIGGTEALILAVFWIVGLLGALLPAWRGVRTSVRSAFLAGSALT